MLAMILVLTTVQTLIKRTCRGRVEGGAVDWMCKLLLTVFEDILVPSISDVFLLFEH